MGEKRFTATIQNGTEQRDRPEVLADDPGQLLRKLGDTITDKYTRYHSHTNWHFTVKIVDTRAPAPLIVKSPSADQLLLDLDRTIRDTYRNELQGDGK